ncbi:hypothetical protein Hdeb2414_s0011g00363271 [Helianthus debilis subsp. tardiflorus]
MTHTPSFFLHSHKIHNQTLPSLSRFLYTNTDTVSASSSLSSSTSHTQTHPLDPSLSSPTRQPADDQRHPPSPNYAQQVSQSRRFFRRRQKRERERERETRRRERERLMRERERWRRGSSDGGGTGGVDRTAAAAVFDFCPTKFPFGVRDSIWLNSV